MSGYVIAIDYDKCTGCRICELTCSLSTTGETNPAKARMRIIKIQENGYFFSIPSVCMKCGDTVCKAVCPMGAISDDPSTGARAIDKDKCIACSACVYACPFGAIAVDRSAGHSYTCSHCDGDPVCVKFCPTEAIQYLDTDEVSLRLRRSAMDKYVTFVRSEST